ncbi:hypothetical protein, partial [Gluconobacter sp. P1D12_c]|uniref:hypothetical protein n=1 Tax=Gluconobacter sp. P1D12_c TaxID=2762614 RepID=UPI001C042C3D
MMLDPSLVLQTSLRRPVGRPRCNRWAQRQDRRHPDPRAGGAAGEHGEDGRRSTCCSAGDRQAAPCFPSWLFMLLP